MHPSHDHMPGAIGAPAKANSSPPYILAGWLQTGYYFDGDEQLLTFYSINKNAYINFLQLIQYLCHRAVRLRIYHSVNSIFCLSCPMHKFDTHLISNCHMKFEEIKAHFFVLYAGQCATISDKKISQVTRNKIPDKL